MSTPDPGWFVNFEDVWLAYNPELLAQNNFAVEAIDLKVRQGEFIAIVGPSGCGKSTFMKLATGLKMPSKGRITIDGAPVTGPLKISGMSFQAPSLLPWRTTVDNVLLPLEIVEPYRSQFKAKRKEYEQRARATWNSLTRANSPISCMNCVATSAPRAKTMRPSPPGARHEPKTTGNLVALGAAGGSGAAVAGDMQRICGV